MSRRPGGALVGLGLFVLAALVILATFYPLVNDLMNFGHGGAAPTVGVFLAGAVLVGGAIALGVAALAASLIGGLVGLVRRRALKAPSCDGPPPPSPAG